MVKMEGSVNDQGVDVPLKKKAQKWKSAQVAARAMPSCSFANACRAVRAAKKRRNELASTPRRPVSKKRATRWRKKRPLTTPK
jgi:hypothetical protein